MNDRRIGQAVYKLIGEMNALRFECVSNDVTPVFIKNADLITFELDDAYINSKYYKLITLASEVKSLSFCYDIQCKHVVADALRNDADELANTIKGEMEQC